MPLHFQGYVADISSGAIYAGFPQYPLRLYPEANYALFDCYSQLLHEAGVGATILIVVEKCLSFFNLYRAYYSGMHNIMNVIHVICYGLALLAWWRFQGSWQKSMKAILQACIAVVLLNVLLTGLFF